MPRILKDLKGFPKPFKVEVGSGGFGREKWDEWIHTDPHVPEGEHHIEIECFAWELPFEDASIGHIYGRGMWEHMNYRQCTLAFEEWLRILIPEGIIEFNFPPVDHAIKLYNQGKVNWIFLRGLLWGWQKFDLDTHQSGWTAEMIHDFLEKYQSKLQKKDIFPGYHHTDGTIVPVESLDSWDQGVHIWVRTIKG